MSRGLGDVYKRQAKEYITSGNYYWNGGMFMFSIATMQAELTKYMPAIIDITQNGYQYTVDNFVNMPDISIDYAVAEKSQKMMMIPMENVYWNDIGSFDAIAEVLSDKDKNVFKGDILAENCTDTMIIGDNRLIAGIDLENLMIIDTPDALLVAKKGESQKVKNIVNKLKQSKRKEAKENVTMYRSWGKYTLLTESEGYRVRKIEMYPGASLTMQMHYHRSEHWTVISGTGNLKLVNTPEVAFPKDFEVYDPKIDNKFTLTREGLSGNKVIEYLAIPRHAGNFTIPPVEFSYFDLKSNSYKTIKTEAYNLKVEKGAGNADQVIADFTNKEDLKVLGQDIRYIKMGETSLTRKGDFFFGSTTYYLWYIIPLVLFIVFVIVYRKKAIENANVAKVRTKKANKVAAKRMKNAGRLLAENKQEAFYDEVLKALWGYISDKLNIPVSQLSKDNIEDELTKYGVAPELIKDFIGTLNECEFARYAPGNQNEAMDKVYSSAVEVISKMESSIKH